MKKNIFIVSLLSLSILLVSLGSTNASTLRERVTDKISENEELKEEVGEIVTTTAGEYLSEDNAKEKLTSVINMAIGSLEAAEQSINESYLTKETKNEVNKIIEETVKALESFQAQLNEAESVEDILEITKQAKEYALAQKDDLIAIFQKVQKELSAITVEEITYAIDELEQALNLLKIICPKQIDEINTIQANLNELEELLISIDNALRNEDYVEVAKLVKESNEMLIESALAIEAILENPCII